MQYTISISILKAKYLLVLWVCLFFSASILMAQPVIYQQNQFFAQDIERQAAAVENSYNASIKPFVNGVNYDKKAIDSVYYERHAVKQYNNSLEPKIKARKFIIGR
jgi:uncharacterized protein YjiK